MLVPINHLTTLNCYCWSITNIYVSVTQIFCRRCGHVTCVPRLEISGMILFTYGVTNFVQFLFHNGPCFQFHPFSACNCIRTASLLFVHDIPISFYQFCCRAIVCTYVRVPNINDRTVEHENV